VGASALYKYGEKVGALLHNEDYAPAYGAAGASIGPVLGAVIGLLFLILIYVLYKKGNRKPNVRESANNVDSYSTIFRLIILTILPVLLSTTVYNISTIIDLRIYNRIMIEKGLDAVKAYNWGVYSGKYRILVNVPIALANAMCSSIVPVLTSLMVQEDYRQAKEKISQAMRFTMIVAIPSTVGLAVLARPIISMLFTGEVDMAVTMLHFGSISVVVYTMSTLTNGVLQGINRMKVPVRNALISLVIHIIFLYIALEAGMGINAVVWGDILFAVVVCILNAMEINRTLRYKQETVKTFIIPTIAAVIMGIVIEILSKILSNFAGNIVTVFIGMIVGVIVYFVALILLKGIDENDLRNMPGGRTMLGFAKRLRLL
jgi:stage V sporulation protein B